MDFHHRYVQIKLGRIMIFMIRSRGTDRNSRITGRSVHNQRIERMSWTSSINSSYHLKIRELLIQTLKFTYMPCIGSSSFRYREASTPSGMPGTFMVSGLKTINHRCNSGQDTESKASWRILQRHRKTTGWTGMDHATIR
ncbi:hypothetical protein AMECASPLE_034017 [Ameca splendens]|uniref:Integrase core domain-containing protein n=1 Tax=Ameca splendens TaxID=208324 RepID=A0ABV0ZSW5_9TELE